jgi:hypothetical protein
MIGSKRLAAGGALAAISVLPLGPWNAFAAPAPPTSSQHVHLDCEYSRLCPDLANPQDVYGSEYVGHDEPSLLFYSNTPGSGNHMRYNMTVPSDPSASNPLTRSYHFELNGAMWFGMALCDTQSFPEQVSTCTPDSDTNIVDPAVSPKHPGTAFLELQFYPPGWVPWPTWAVAVGASACDPVKWCAAMNVFSLLEDPVAGTFQNPSCAAKIGIETFEFAFVTKDGVSQAPANPLDATLTTYTPDSARDLFMSSGDNLQVSIHDTANGVQAQINDVTSGESGSMTASPANGFAQFKYAPTGKSCKAIPYAFHPMYSTSSEQTRVIWAAHSYNVGFSSEIGHFEFCNGAAVPATPFGVDGSGNPIACPSGNTEGVTTDQEPTEGPPPTGDDDFCFPASEALRIKVQGCTETNTGFDGISYQPVWPDGNTNLHPTSLLFNSPRFGSNYDQAYSRTAFEADLPRIESNTCNRTTGAGCTLIPTTDDGAPAAFYPFFSTTSIKDDAANGPDNEAERTCNWQFGGSIPGSTNEFGQNTQYGSLLNLTYLAFGGGGATIQRFNDFRGVIPNPC